MMRLVEEHSGTGELLLDGVSLRSVRYQVRRFQGFLEGSGMPIPGLHRIEGSIDFDPRNDPAEWIGTPNVADPFHVISLSALMDALQKFARGASLPTDDVELMQLAAKYLEEDELVEADLDVQTYVQLMLSARQALARRQALWIVG